MNTSNSMNELLENGFNINETAQIRNSLYKLTKKIFKNYKIIFLNDTKSINQLIKNFKYIPTTKDNWKNTLSVLVSYMDQIKKNGTPQFCRAARLTFIAKDFIKSFIDHNPEYRKDGDSLLSQIKTVSSAMQEDLAMAQASKNKKQFF
jgi:flagellar motor component MotA